MLILGGVGYGADSNPLAGLTSTLILVCHHFVSFSPLSVWKEQESSACYISPTDGPVGPFRFLAQNRENPSQEKKNCRVVRPSIDFFLLAPIGHRQTTCLERGQFCKFFLKFAEIFLISTKKALIFLSFLVPKQDL